MTWVEQTLDAMSIRHIRDWLEMSISACVKETLTLLKTGCGMGVSSFKHIAQKIVSTNALLYATQCTSTEIQQVWTDLSSKHIKRGPLDCSKQSNNQSCEKNSELGAKSQRYGSSLESTITGPCDKNSHISHQ